MADRRIGERIRLKEPDFLPKRTTIRKTGTYKPEFDRQVYFLALLGLTYVQMSQVLNVSVPAIMAWEQRHEGFAEAIRRGKAEADGKVAFSLFQAAVGYEHKDVVVLTNKVKEYDEKGRVVKEWNEPLIVDVVKRYPPNVTAAIKWLQARQPAVWSDRMTVSGKLNVTHQLDLSDFSLDELELLNTLSKKRSQRQTEDTPYQEVG